MLNGNCCPLVQLLIVIVVLALWAWIIMAIERVHLVPTIFIEHWHSVIIMFYLNLKFHVFLKLILASPVLFREGDFLLICSTFLSHHKMGVFSE